MFVKIIKSWKPAFWYSDFIGKVFDVTVLNKHTVQVKRPPFSPGIYTISRMDCRPIKRNARTVHQQAKPEKRPVNKGYYN